MAIKKLGQHFLKNKKLLELIASLTNQNCPSTVIEIGPGHGELTEFLVKTLPSETKIIAIEKDKNLVYLLSKKFSQQKNLTILNGDILKLLEKIVPLKKTPYKIVGNIPYYITGHLLKIISELKQKPAEVILLIQKEVAQRISACPPKMNILSAITQRWSTPQIIKYVSKKNFSPAPEVDSAILVLKTRKVNNKLFKEYCNFIKILFKQPRKTVLNNLKNLPKSVFNQLLKHSIPFNARPQNLNMDIIEKMFKIYSRYNKK